MKRTPLRKLSPILLAAVAVGYIAWLGIRLNRSMDLKFPLITGYENAKRMEPWTVVCDEKSGKFTFRGKDTLAIEEFDTREAAESKMRIYMLISEGTRISPEENARIDAIWAKNWKACKKP
jgi:hypothetical protein